MRGCDYLEKGCQRVHQNRNERPQSPKNSRETKVFRTSRPPACACLLKTLNPLHGIESCWHNKRDRHAARQTHSIVGVYP
jgi:hypothetical protein